MCICLTTGLFVLLLAGAVALGAGAAPSSATGAVSVGTDSGEFVGADSYALQKAADEVARRFPTGGGTLLIGPGTYTMYDSLHIRVPMTVRGAGPSTILKKGPAFARVRLAQDFDLSEYVAVVADASALRPGMGITIKDRKQQHGWGANVRTIVAIAGNQITLDRRPERDYAHADEAWIQSSFPIISARNISDVVIEDLAVDGNIAENRDAFLDGCRGGGIYLHEARRCIIRRCTVRNYNGDGFSWQTTDGVLVEDCLAEGNANLGFHPGTGSPRTIVRNCRAVRNGSMGLFLCWGVRHGTFENNVLEDNASYGISIGHKDTDNLFVNNQVRRNGVGGVHFREEPEFNAGHRCTLRGNVIEDNGTAGKAGFGVKIEGATRDTVLEGNTIRDTRPQGKRTQLIAVEVGPRASGVVIRPDNRIEGELRNVGG